MIVKRKAAATPLKNTGLLMLPQKTMIEWYANYAELPLAKAKEQWKSVCAFIADTLLEGERISIPNIGTFDFRERPARTCRNVRTGEPIDVPARMSPVLKFTKSFRDAVAASVPVIEQ